jgi:hypothetical protein
MSNLRSMHAEPAHSLRDLPWELPHTFLGLDEELAGLGAPAW